MPQNNIPEIVYSVSDAIDYVNIALNREIVVEGEISRIDRRQGTLLFVTLMDAYSAIDVFGVTFRIQNHNELAPGMKVKVYGTPGLYKKSGRFRIDAREIVPAGEGALRVAFERLRARLEAEGLFALERKRDLPRFPEKIALVTAAGSQAYKDFVKVLQARFGGISIDFYPSQVQGVGAEKMLLGALGAITASNTPYDAVVLVRGGGSLEDLQVFNSESVARAVFSSRFPVICGVGHEGDISLCDLVADVRASTPSNAAELLVPERTATANEIQSIVSDTKNNLLHAVQLQRHSISQSTLKTSRYFEQLKSNFNILNQNIMTQMQHLLQETRTSVANQTRLIRSYDPTLTLKRGYSILRKKDGTILRSRSRSKKGDELSAQLSDGIIEMKVTKI